MPGHEFFKSCVKSLIGKQNRGTIRRACPGDHDHFVPIITLEQDFTDPLDLTSARSVFQDRPFYPQLEVGHVQKRIAPVRRQS